MDEVSRNELKPILNDMKAINLDGYSKCKSAIIFQQIVSGSYIRKDDIVNVRDLMGPMMVVEPIVCRRHRLDRTGMDALSSSAPVHDN